MTAEQVQFIEITNRWELAERLTSESQAPEEALTAVFKGIIEGIEEKTTIESSIKERIWSAISKEKLKTLKHVFIVEICNQILGTFSEEEALLILEEHRKLGTIQNIYYSTQIQKKFHNKSPSVIKVVCDKAKTMIPDLLNIVEKEGVQI